MKRSGLLLIGAALLLLVVFSAGLHVVMPTAHADPEALAAANKLYEAGHHASAARLYEQIAAQGVDDAAVYYNLGNAYFQQGEVVRAVHSYEHALRLAPRDADIRANLELARAQATELASQPDGPLEAVAHAAGWLTLNETAVLALAAWFVLGFVLLALSRVPAGKPRRVLRVAATATVALLLVALLVLGVRIYSEQMQPEGTVVLPSVALSSSRSPSSMGPDQIVMTTGVVPSSVATVETRILPVLL